MRRGQDSPDDEYQLDHWDDDSSIDDLLDCREGGSRLEGEAPSDVHRSCSCCAVLR